MAAKFVVEIKGKDFTLTMQGSGSETSARKYLAEVFENCKVRIRDTGEPIDIDSGP